DSNGIPFAPGTSVALSGGGAGNTLFLFGTQALRGHTRAATRRPGGGPPRRPGLFGAMLVTERKLGDLLVAEGERRGGNSHGGSSAPLPEGVTPNPSHRWRQVAAVPEPAFREHVAQVAAAGEELTTAGVLQLARQFKREEATRRNWG